MVEPLLVRELSSLVTEFSQGVNRGVSLGINLELEILEEGRRGLDVAQRRF